jgi:hypothetical protein
MSGALELKRQAKPPMGIGGDKNANEKWWGFVRWMERIVLCFTKLYVGVVGGLGLGRLAKSNFQDVIISCCHIADASHALRLHLCIVQHLCRRLHE